MPTTLIEIFRDSETHHRLSLFDLPDDATIKKVKQQITAARAARREAHALLERAKQAVETAIEKNEKAGMAML